MEIKSPAINFYTSDFLTGTTFFTNKEVGGYIRLLCYQHQLGHLDIAKIDITLHDFNDQEKSNVLSKFLIDKNNKYFNKRMDNEIFKKKKYSESRANNRKSKKTYEEDMNNICNSYEEHMENEIEIDIDNNINSNIDFKKEEYERKNLLKISFNKFWEVYPKKVQKDVAFKSFQKLKIDDDLLNIILEKLELQKKQKQWEDKQYIPNPSTYLNQRRWEDEIIKSKEQLDEEMMERVRLECSQKK